MSYIPDATVTSEPIDSRKASTAALEFRTLKAYIQGALMGIINSKLAASAYTAQDVLDKLKTVDGLGSGLDANLFNGNGQAFFQNASNLNTGTVSTARLASGAPSASNFLCGDQTWKAPTTAMLGIPNVENKNSAQIRAELQQQEVFNALGYRPAGEFGQFATGTWPLNISGNAASASSVAWLSVTGRPAITGMTPDTANTPGTVMVRDGSGNTFANHYWQGAAQDDSQNVGTFIVTNSSDNFFRRIGIQHAYNTLVIPRHWGVGNQSIATPGYQRLLGGLILQWGRVSTTVGNGATNFVGITYPIPFTAGAMAQGATLFIAQGSCSVGITPNTNSTGEVSFANNSGGTLNLTATWWALGY